MKAELTKNFGRQSISIRDGAGALFRRKGLILLTFVTVLVGTVVVTWLLPDKYESHLKILVKNQRVDLAITPEATNGNSIALSGNEVSENQINSEIELLSGRDLLTKVVRECNLASAKPGWFSRTPAPEAVRVEKAVNRLSKELVITPVRKANIISISYSADSPELAATVLKKLGDLYLEKHLELHHPTGATDFFKDQADEYGARLKEAELKFGEFQQSNNLVVLNEQKQLTLQKTAEAKTKLLESETAASEATNRIARVEQQLASMPKRVITQSRQLPNQYSAERLNTMIVELQNRRTQLLTKFRPEDRLVREVDEQIKITREALAKAEQKTSIEQATDLNPLRQGLETELSRAKLDQAGAMARRASLAGQLQSYEAALKKLESDTIKHDELQRDLKQAEDNYQLYSKKREESRIADELDRQKITNVSIAEIPTAAALPTSPNRVLNLVLGLVLAVLLSLGSVFSAELMTGTVHSARQLEALTGAPVLATVPDNNRRVIGRIRQSNQIAVESATAQLRG